MPRSKKKKADFQKIRQKRRTAKNKTRKLEKHRKKNPKDRNPNIEKNLSYYKGVF